MLCNTNTSTMHASIAVACCIYILSWTPRIGYLEPFRFRRNRSVKLKTLHRSSSALVSPVVSINTLHNTHFSSIKLSYIQGVSPRITHCNIS